ncbi:outer membrane beta-barrel protein [Pontibacter chitinilyticus]|uniref:outer membrane beta-barrel protein n=1 Tax=Pontibacter chitinilyticus TaxID=2674989 RepID=UPI0032192A8F
MLLLRKQTAALFLCFVLSLLAFQQGFGQSKGYIIKGESVYTQGYIHFNTQEPQEVKFSFMRDGTPRTYTVEELTGFGFLDSTTYAAKTIVQDGKPQRLFVEVIGDSAFLYLERDQAFFKHTKAPEQIYQKDLLSYLQSLTNSSEKWYPQLHLFQLKRNSLRYFGRYKQAAKQPAIPFYSRGLFTSFNIATLHTQSNTQQPAFADPLETASPNISIGGFVNLPLWSVRNLALQAQASYGKMRFNETKQLPKARYDIKLDLDFARLSLMPQYTLSSSKTFRLFVQAGPSAIYLLKSESEGLESIEEGDNVWTSPIAGLPVTSKAMFGYEAGVGLSFFYLPQHYLSLGLNHSAIHGRNFNISNQSLTVSVNL